MGCRRSTRCPAFSFGQHPRNHWLMEQMGTLTSRNGLNRHLCMERRRSSESLGTISSEVQYNSVRTFRQLRSTFYPEYDNLHPAETDGGEQMRRPCPPIARVRQDAGCDHGSLPYQAIRPMGSHSHRSRERRRSRSVDAVRDVCSMINLTQVKGRHRALRHLSARRCRSAE
jgi:hypothetical protein